MNVFELLFLLLALVSSILFLIIRSQKRAGKLPPGPYPLPIVGNIFHLSGAVYRSLANLSKTYGPIMSIHLGSRYAVVVSTIETATLILQKHDQAFSGRLTTAALYAHNFHSQSIICLPPGKQWRKFRKICKEHLFSVNCLDSSQALRQEQLRKLREYVEKCGSSGREVNIRKAASATLINLMFATLFSAEPVEFDGENNTGLHEIIKTCVRYLGALNIADLFPILQPLDPQGIKRDMKRNLGKLLTMIEDIINQRLKSRSTLGYQKNKDFLETMLDISQGSESELTTKEIKHLILDLILGGTETSSITTEWTMTELLLNPEKLRKAKHELQTVIGENRAVQESDFPQLPYLQAIIKEVFRLYPVGPLLFHHKAESDVEVNGYVIPKGSLALVNVWAIGRDQSLWENPDSFEPERFLEKKIDYTGQNFQLIPFGAGRRMCPGLPLAYRMVHSMVATLIRNFDWEFEANAEAALLHRRVISGIVLQKSVPLQAIPINSKP